MTPQDFIKTWRNSTLTESSGSQSHFNNLCAVLGIDPPATADPKGEWFTFEKGAPKTGGGEGWADVWRKGCFAWEYKGKKKDLNKAFAQLQQYAIALENPPLLIVSDMERFRIHTNWTNTVQQVHEFALDDLMDASTRDLLRNAFEHPEELRPAKTRQMLTEEAAEEFAQLAQRLRTRGHEGHEVAHFVNRLVFCMFAEDVGLLPDHMFSAMLRASRTQPDDFAAHARTLFAAMKTGGLVGFTKVDWFNGGLFDDDSALPLERDDIDNLISAADLDWSEVDPSILGTLFERGLDPDKRSQLGAHYTDRDKIMQIVEPVIIRPLSAEWEASRTKIEALIASAPQQTAERLLTAAQKAKRTRAYAEAQEVLRAFTERLRAFRVLDPACGSGNFLYLSLLALKDLEHRANLEAEALGCSREFPAVGPESVLGIELNPYAAELARVSVWIGEIQWMRRNGFEAGRNPILRSLGNIEWRDAVLDVETGERAVWPEANVVVGNPPFLGNKKMMGGLGEDYTRALRAAWQSVPDGADLVCYWFAKAWEMMRGGPLERAGFVSTQSIRRGTNRKVLVPVVENGRIFEAQSDEEWTVDGADVRVSIICFDQEAGAPALLDGKLVQAIGPDLQVKTSSEQPRVLTSNKKVAGQGTISGGPFEIGPDLARHLLMAPINPNGRANAEVLRPWRNGDDLTDRPADQWIIDFGGLTLSEASLFEEPYAWLSQAWNAAQQARKDAGERLLRAGEPRTAERWWLLQRRRDGLLRDLSSRSRYLATPRVSKHRFFVWLGPEVIPDTRLVAFRRDDDTFAGILHSRIHEVWSLSLGGKHGVGNDPEYVHTATFETFPFPEGLTPDTPAADYADDPRAQAIATAAARLNELRENWLNPSDLIERVPEVVPGYPDRILPKDEAAAQVLKKRTLTNLYNQRPAWLNHAHRALNEAVADAYGWGDDFRAGTLTDDEILARLFHLNQERAEA